jgi:hypothetical protein
MESHLIGTARAHYSKESGHIPGIVASHRPDLTTRKSPTTANTRRVPGAYNRDIIRTYVNDTHKYGEPGHVGDARQTAGRKYLYAPPRRLDFLTSVLRSIVGYRSMDPLREWQWVRNETRASSGL